MLVLLSYPLSLNPRGSNFFLLYGLKVLVDANSLLGTFFYGKCPCCDGVIPVPSGIAEVYCCYCGAKFRSSAAVALYGVKGKTAFSSGEKTALKPNIAKPALQNDVPDPSSLPHMMTVREFAKATGISEYSVRRLLKQGTIPAVYAGTKALINYTKAVSLLDSLNLKHADTKS